MLFLTVEFPKIMGSVDFEQFSPLCCFINRSRCTVYQIFLKCNALVVVDIFYDFSIHQLWNGEKPIHSKNV